MDKKEEDTKELDDDVSALTNQYRQGNIHNINTANNEFNKLISAVNPKLILYNSWNKRYANTHPVVLRTQEKRFDKVSRSIERVLRSIEMNRFKIVSSNLLLLKPVGDDYDFTATWKRRYKHSDGS